jgi:hypothetical protein
VTDRKIGVTGEGFELSHEDVALAIRMLDQFVDLEGAVSALRFVSEIRRWFDDSHGDSAESE